MRKSQFTPHQFWIENENYETVKVELHKGTLYEFGCYLLKIALEANDLRNITKHKVRYIEMWNHYLNTSPDGKLLSDDLHAIVGIIAYDIIDKTVIFTNTPTHPMNSRQRNSVEYVIKKELIKALDYGKK